LRIRFDQGPAGPGTGFDRPAQVIRADRAEQVPQALAALDDARAQGGWLAGYASYELGYALEPKLTARLPETRRLPLLCFGVFDGPSAQDLPSGAAGLSAFQPRWSEARYAEAFRAAWSDGPAPDLTETGRIWSKTRVAPDALLLFAGATPGTQAIGGIIQWREVPHC